VKQGVGIYINGSWHSLRERVIAEFAKSGLAENEIEFRHFVRMQYLGQLNDLEIYSPHQELSEASQVDDLIAAFEEAYGKRYARSARSPELGYLVTNVIVTGAVAVEKPALPSEGVEEGVPAMRKDQRQVFWHDAWARTPIYEQDDVRAGHILEGPAVVESPADTFAIPPGRIARMDEHRIWHLENA
jgi:N-methylhydantoinase A/acetone carboxylase beta subunit